MDTNNKSAKLGLRASTALVMGNMIGGGIFLLPSALASYGGISMIGWLVSAIGSMALALVFSRLARLFPGKNGGPYAYTREGFGDFMGFLIAWGYWISIWTANAAISVTFVGALSVFIPALAYNSILAVLVGLSAIWSLTWINTLGIKKGALVQVITTFLKIIPLAVISIGGIFLFNLDHFQPFNRSEDSIWAAILATATMTLYAFLGFESATIPAQNIDNPERTIPRATILGTSITAIIYMLCTFSVMGILAPQMLENSPAPLAEAAAALGGEELRYFIAGGIVIATFGALNGWILILGQIPMSIADDGLFPEIFRKRNKHGVPTGSLIIGSILVSLIMLLNYSDQLVEQFKFMTLLTTLSVLTPYLFSTAAYALFVLNGQTSDKRMMNGIILSLLAFVYSMWAVFGSGEESVFWGFILLLLGIPFYVLVKWKKGETK